MTDLDFRASKFLLAAEIWKTQTRPREYSVDEVRDAIYEIVLLELEGVF